MADYLDSEAEESEEEDKLDRNGKKRHKKIKAMCDSDEEDDEEEYGEVPGLIDDNPIEENDGEDSDGSNDSSKRKKSDDEDFDDRLEDEDYDLLEENLGVKVERKRRFKRLRRIQEEESEEEGNDLNQERDTIANELFLASGDEDEGRSEISHRVEMETLDEEESEDEDDFIVDGDGMSMSERRKKKKPIFSDAALQEAQDIFGVDFDYDEFGKYGKDGYEEEEEDEDYINEDAQERPRRSKKHFKQQTTRQSIFEIYEPSELKRGHFTDMDNEIRTTDIPERMQLRCPPITAVTEGSDELDLESEWIYKYAFCDPTISIQDAHLTEEAKERAKKSPQTIGKIKKTLDFIRNQNFEVPFISFYRKEYVSPELNINDMWKIYKFDAKWCQLKERKQNLMVLFEKMRNYQLDEIMKNPEAPLSDNVRVIKDDDIDRLKNAQTNEEVNDVYRHFMLYYGHEIQTMQENFRQKEKEAHRQARIQKKKQEIREAKENGENPYEDIEEIEEKKEGDETLKQPIRKGPYELCRKGGLEAFAKKFGLTPEYFAENLRDNYQRHEVEQDPTELATLAEDFCTQVFQTPEEVLKGVQLMVAIQLANEPLARKCVREMYIERAKLSVKPTKRGIKQIDENHSLYALKYLKDKPTNELVGDQFLKLITAEQDNLITISFSDTVDGNTTSNYIEEIKQLYYRDEFSKNVQDWNALRVGSVDIALRRFIIPHLKKELRTNLTIEAKECVMKSCCRQIYNWIKIGPYTCELFEDHDEEWDTAKGIRVMGLAYVPDYSQAAFVCIVTPDGECSDYLRLPHLTKRKNSPSEDEKILKEADVLALKNFMAAKKPHVVVVAGESREATMIVEDVKECISTLAMEEQFPLIEVEISDNELAKIFSNSNRGTSEFRDYPDLLRQAISLARRLQDPLLEFSQLCNVDEEILCLKYHPLQDELPKEELLENLYFEFINRVNEVGVDLNKAVQMPYFANLVQFVCGLGSRKAHSLLKLLKQNNQRLENRTQLVTACHMGPKVFINCAGFIKIDTNSLGDSTEAYVEVLDGSRVHPETYEWARKMAVDALEYDDEDANPAGALEEILESPERLKDLDLDAFAEELERQGFGNKGITLYDIRAELNSRYKDLRVAYESPSAEKLFDILTKETPETFYIGKIVLAKVVGINRRKPQGEQLDQANPVRNDETGLWQCPFCLKNDFPELSEVWNHFDAGSCLGKATGVRLKLDNGISGYIHIKNLSDKHVDDPEERVFVGQMIHCRIIKIEVERFSVECTSKSSDLLDENHEFRPQRDLYYDTEAQERDAKTEEDTKRMKQRQTYLKRVIIHPSFHNISFAEVERLMQSMKQGEAIIRPSSKGADHLTVSWKVTDNIHHHIDVREEGKENAFSLGRSLLIGSEEFEDLDEIIARHINPMAAYASEILDFKYYKPNLEGHKDMAEEILKEQKKQNPGGIPYIVSAAKNYPGKFLLSYLPRIRCRHEYITVSPEGFRFRGQIFNGVSNLFRWFKEHFRDPIPGTITPGTPHEATTSRTPYNTTTGGMDQDVIQRVAQNMPHHMLHTLSKATNQTPHHYPCHTPGGLSVTTYGGMYTPYTPSGQTPFMTPYQTPHYQETPSHVQGPFLLPIPPAPNANSHRSPRAHHRSTVTDAAASWSKAAEAWAKQPAPRQMSSSSWYDDDRKNSRGNEDATGKTMSGQKFSTERTPSYKSPRGTSFKNSSPQSMSLSGNRTPLYDENWTE